MTDELSEPLGSRKRKRGKALSRRLSMWPWGRIGLGVLVVSGLFTAFWVGTVQDPAGGRPVAEAPISVATEPNPVAVELARELPPEAIDIPATGAGPSFITLGDDIERMESAIAQIDAQGALPELVEQSHHGPLPRVGADGTRPHTAYARPSLTPQTAGGRKLIAVTVTGLGLNDAMTEQAITSLPGAITLAFAPYGANVSTLAQAAKAAGHEVMLEIPLEPFDYPQNDPGPHTLLAQQPPRDNLEKLYWLMARIGGYTGVLNHMGARFTASAADFGPIMEELGMRGLSYLDDGSSNRSVAPQLARQNNVPFARADLEIDTNPSRAAILAQLAALEAQADERGWALGTISALPVSIRTLAEWAGALDKNTYLLVPVSALAVTAGANAQ